MPGSTSFYQWPYPLAGDTVDVPRDIKSLADKLETIKNGLTVPTGDVIVGQVSDGAGRYVRWRRLVSGVQYEMTAHCAGAAWQLTTIVNGVAGAQFQYFNSGQMFTEVGGVSRPRPFAVAAGDFPVSVPGANAGVSVAVTFPSGRFTLAPVVTALGESNGYSAASMGGSTVTGVGLRFFNPTAATHTAPRVSWHAIQMTTSAAPGLRAPRAPTGLTRTVVCDTEGCGNAGVPIVLTLEEEFWASVYCGVCSEVITDIRE